MKKHLRQFISLLRHVQLTDAERATLTRDMRAFVVSHQVRVSLAPRHRFQLLITTRPMIATIAVIITLILGGGVSAAAENAVPGDLLYSVKVNINEEVRAAIAVKPVAKARVAADRAERRLEEIAILAMEGKLDEKTKIAIETKIAVHTTEVQTQLAASENAGESLQVRANIEAQLKASEKILKKAHGKYAVKVNIGAVIDLLSASSTVGVSTTPVSTTTPSLTPTTTPATTTFFLHAASDKMKAAANKIEEVKRFIDHAREKYGIDAVARASIHLQAAQTVFMQGTTALDVGNYREAFRLFQEAHVKAQEAKLLVEFRKKFHLDIDIGNGTTTASTSGGVLIDIRKEKQKEKEEEKEEREGRLEEMREMKEDLEERREEWKEDQKKILEKMKELQKKKLR